MHFTFAFIASAISWIGFVAFFIRRRRRRQRISRKRISRKGGFGLLLLFLILGAVIAQSQYLFLDEPLVHAAQRGDLMMAQALLAYGANANAYGDEGGGSALVAAAAAGHANLVTLLVRNGADVNQKSENFVSGLGNATPLQAASAFPEIVRYLKRSGAKD